MAAEKIFELEHVAFAYPGGEPVLTDLSLSIERGESIVLLGANASGKSSLLLLLAGLRFATQGTVRAFGEPLTEAALAQPLTARRFRQQVGMMFQHSDAQLFCATVEEELAFGPLQLRLPRDEVRQRVEDTLQLLDIAQLRERTPQTLSGGEKKRVALGGLLTCSPQVLLLDEPTAGLDPRSQQWLLELLCDLRAAGVSLITASHDLELAPELADRALVLSETHRIFADGAVSLVTGDLDLLLSANLIHAHAHQHGAYRHIHPHLPGCWHAHEQAADSGSE